MATVARFGLRTSQLQLNGRAWPPRSPSSHRASWNCGRGGADGTRGVEVRGVSGREARGVSGRDSHDDGPRGVALLGVRVVWHESAPSSERSEVTNCILAHCSRSAPEVGKEWMAGTSGAVPATARCSAQASVALSKRSAQTLAERPKAITVAISVCGVVSSTTQRLAPAS